MPLSSSAGRESYCSRGLLIPESCIAEDAFGELFKGNSDDCAYSFYRGFELLSPLSLWVRRKKTHNTERAGALL